MAVKTKKPTYAQRQLKKLKRDLAHQHELRLADGVRHTDYRAHAGEVLRAHLAKLRRAEETLVSNNMTMRELNDQVAMQWQQRAEARSDVERATSLTAEAVAKHNRMAESLRESWDEKRELANLVGLLRRQAEEAGEALAEAQRSFSNRTWEAITLKIKEIKAYSRHLRWQIRNRWLVWRLNKPRIHAMSEAGYIPGKLIKMAEEYWETDKRRMGETITNYSTYPADEQYVSRQTLWRRFRIWMGRA